MFQFFNRTGIAAIVALAVVYGCGDESGSPTAPNSRFEGSQLFDLPTCGEVTYLGELAPLLTAWGDSIEAWLPGITLAATPEWTGGDVAPHLALLIPALQQWRTAIHAAAGSEFLVEVNGFDSQTMTSQSYLSYLASLLVGWKGAMETARGTVFLAAPPVFAPDDVAPFMACPLDTTLLCAEASGAVLEFEVVAVDDCDEAPVVVCTPASGSVFPVGITTVTCTATDLSGNTTSCSFAVTVEPRTVIIDGITPSPSVIWPPNHRMVDVSFDIDAQNECEIELSCTVLEVFSNEPTNGLGDGNTEPDWIIGANGGLKLRAERSGTGSDRIYQIRLRCEDSSGVGDESTVEVVVPHDQGGENSND